LEVFVDDKMTLLLLGLWRGSIAWWEHLEKPTYPKVKEQKRREGA
jgi:hypothetical protein